MRPLTGAVDEATDLKLMDLNLYLHSVQQFTLNQILQILNLLHHSTSDWYISESYSDSELMSLRFSRFDRLCTRLLRSANPSGRPTPPLSL